MFLKEKMPTISVNAQDLCKRLDPDSAIPHAYTDDEFQLLCFAFGLELDDVTTEDEIIVKNTGKSTNTASKEIIYKIDVPANRYDLLCIEGIARALRVFLGREKVPVFRLAIPTNQSLQVLTVTANTLPIRPFAVAAVLRGVTFTAKNYASFIDLQEKLHFNLCRKRTLVAIGTHDLSTVQGPFTYDAEPADNIKFKPLRSEQDKEYTATELFVEYRKDMQLKQYIGLVCDAPLIPVIRDSTGRVLSMPPIINGYHSRITLDTRDVFIECTATDYTKAKTVLKIIVAMFSEYCSVPFDVEPVTVIASDGSTALFPNVEVREETVDPTLLNRRIGITESTQSLANLLTKMQLPTTVTSSGQLSVNVPIVRPDVLHECDIWEDAAIAFGYNNIPKVEPKVACSGKQLPINKLTDLLRGTITSAGYTEALTFALCSREDGFSNLRRIDDGASAVSITNPKTPEFQIARVNLLSGLLRTIYYNTRLPLPLKVFEISDVLFLSPTSESGAYNQRNIAAAFYNSSPGFEVVLGLLDVVMTGLRVRHEVDSSPNKATWPVYSLAPSTDRALFSELGAADIMFQGKCIGILGVVHPEVLANFGLKNPVGAFEFNLEVFL